MKKCRNMSFDILRMEIKIHKAKYFMSFFEILIVYIN